ncbi:MAG TPA: ATP-binding protein [Polyangia bacterium]|jgi:two-component system sensor histidine kinase RegB|nr:ATP-binding protein [Polyangia bacterium]
MGLSPAHPNQINFNWLIRLRWATSAGQLATILGVRYGMGLPIPLPPLLLLVATALVVNVLCVAVTRRRAPEEWWLAAVMALDVVIFTGLLYFTGGPLNPFSFLYLVPIALAAITLRALWTWALVMLSLLCSAVLFAWHDDLPMGSGHAEHMDWHLRGMWVAFGVAAGFIVHFLLRVRRALEARDAELAESRQAAARQERLASLATLAAGAAHELSTPLSTIAVVVKELERAMQSSVPGADMADDIRLVRGQIDRCRAILERMCVDAGETLGETFVATSLNDIVSASTAGLPNGVIVRSQVEAGLESVRVRVPFRALAQALAGVLKNAQDVSREGDEIAVRVFRRAGCLHFEVRDRGKGIAPEVMGRIGEPFFTTKAAGEGMGLGVFLARAVVERLGGELVFDSQIGRGTSAVLRLPAGVIEGGSPVA